MGTIAARDCARVNTLTAQVIAACLLAAFQALRLRLEKGELQPGSLGETEKTFNEIAGFFKPLEDDRPLEAELRMTLDLIGKRQFSV